MIKSITVTNFLGESMTMVLDNPWESGFIIRKIDGLGPAKAYINITNYSGSDGGEYNSARADVKNVVLDLKFLEKPDIETTRQLSYKYFPIKKKLTLTIETDYRKASIDGYVESNEPDIFSEDEGCQISILCPNPYFYSDKNITVFSGLEQLFEFPYENNGLEPATVFGEILNLQYRTIHYDGDVDTGFVMLINCKGHVENISMMNKTTNETMIIDTDKIATIMGTEYGLYLGDEILISTVKGDRYITLYRNGTYYNIMNALDRRSKWIQLYRGDNKIAYNAEIGVDVMDFRISNTVLYEGV